MLCAALATMAHEWGERGRLSTTANDSDFTGGKRSTASDPVNASWPCAGFTLGNDAGVMTGRKQIDTRRPDKNAGCGRVDGLGWSQDAQPGGFKRKGRVECDHEG